MPIASLDVHVAGGLVRLLTSGVPRVEGATLAARASALEEAAGPALMALCREPRALAGTVTAVFAEADSPDADGALLLFDDAGPMAACGHALLGATAVALARGLLLPRHPGRVRIETLSGLIDLRAPESPLSPSGPWTLSYLARQARVLRANQAVVIGRRTVHVDVVWTGAGVSAIVDAEAAGVPLVAARQLELQRGGLDVHRHLNEAVRLVHPIRGSRVETDAVVFIGVAPEHGAEVMSATVTSDGLVERSPCAESTVAVATVLFAMGALPAGQPLIHQGLVGTNLRATAVPRMGEGSDVDLDVEVEGQTWPIGEHTFVFQPDDPLVDGVEWRPPRALHP